MKNNYMIGQNIKIKANSLFRWNNKKYYSGTIIDIQERNDEDWLCSPVNYKTFIIELNNKKLIKITLINDFESIFCKYTLCN